MTKVLFVFGTRPEAIKLAPLIHEMKKRRTFRVKVCVTAQHRQMLDSVLDFFSVKPDFDLGLMRPNQSLFSLTSSGITGLEKILDKFRPGLIIVQGDTTSTFLGALAGYYKKIPVAHVEAGLRSGDRFSPFPEETNRILTAHLTDFHFPPTNNQRRALAKEGITKDVHVVGNTVVDALLMAHEMVRKRGFMRDRGPFNRIDFGKKIVLVTGHRRESFGKPFESICMALKRLAERNPDAEIIYPMHLNPNVRGPVLRILKGIANIHLLEPLSYPQMIWLLARCRFVLTDSGGIQEEAPSFGKPVLVMRDTTERREGIKSGNAMLVGTSMRKIISEAQKLLSDSRLFARMSAPNNPYGDGKASIRIAAILARRFSAR